MNRGGALSSTTSLPIFINIFVGVVALKVFWDVATETVAIKHMYWSDKAIIVFLNSGFKLLTSVLYARIIVIDAQTWRICMCMLKSAISRHISRKKV